MNKRLTERLIRLGTKAWAFDMNDELSGTDAAMDADEAFWTLAHAQMTQEQRDALDDMCVKATGAECIEHGFTVLGVAWTPPVLGAPNFDAMTRDELLEFARRAVAEKDKLCKELFPAYGLKVARKAVTTLGNYAVNKAIAVKSREEGSIAFAVQMEKRCDKCFAELPTWAKW